MSIVRPLFACMAATLLAVPAVAQTTAPPRVSIPIPEPTDFALFAAGVIGLFIGRRSSRNRKRD